MAPRAAIYVRISSDPTGKAAGVRRQEEDCRALAERKGWELVEVFIDNDVSAYSGKPRPGYRRLFEAIQSRQVNGVIAWHPDRLHRSPRELEDFIDLVNLTRCAVATVQAGEYDLSTSSGRMTARVVGAVARGESEHKSDRIRRKHLELARAGRPSGGGARPFGFEADRKSHRRDEARLIREAAKRLLGGESLRGIVADFQSRNVKTPTGRVWRPSPFRDMIRSARIAGLREHQGKTYTAVWKPIIHRETHERLRALLDHPARKTNGIGTARRYLLTGGLAVCGVCGRKLIARPRAPRNGEQSGARCYVCPPVTAQFEGCGKIRRLSEPVEEFVAGQLFEAFENSPVFIERLQRSAQKGDDRELLGHLRDLRERRSEIEAEYVVGEIDLASLKRMMAALEERIDHVQGSLADKTRDQVLATLPSGGVGVIEKAWDAHGLEWRRAVISAFIEKVIVHPAIHGLSRFDPSRIEIVWRI